MNAKLTERLRESLNMQELNENSMYITETPRSMDPYAIVLCNYQLAVNGEPVYMAIDRACKSLAEAEKKMAQYDLSGTEPVNHLNCFVAGLAV